MLLNGNVEIFLEAEGERNKAMPVYTAAKKFFTFSCISPTEMSQSERKLNMDKKAEKLMAFVFEILNIA